MLDIAIPQDTGYPVNGTGTAIEMCRDCPQGYEGYSCEECSQVCIYKKCSKIWPFILFYIQLFDVGIKL